jgi:hypothetical protein
MELYIRIWTPAVVREVEACRSVACRVVADVGRSRCRIHYPARPRAMTCRVASCRSTQTPGQRLSAATRAGLFVQPPVSNFHLTKAPENTTLDSLQH